eukprot:8442773-Pyramimonas_sp.AAC.1
MPNAFSQEPCTRRTTSPRRDSLDHLLFKTTITTVGDTGPNENPTDVENCQAPSALFIPPRTSVTG